MVDAPTGSPDGAGGPDGGAVLAESRFAGVTAVKGLPARDGWLVLLETLQPEFFFTIPARSMVLLDERLDTVKTYEPLEGWTLIDAATHPSGDVSAVYVRVNQTGDPMELQLSRYRTDGSRVDTEVTPVPPSDPNDPTVRLILSYDRARVVAVGEDLYLAARWAGNPVYAYHFTFGADGFRPEWATRVEPEAWLGVIGIIGGGFDNFHQGDNAIFVYLDVDGAGNAYVVAPSTETVLPNHDAAFGENLSAGADPAHFDFGTAILTKIDAGGSRVYASLLGTPGRGKSLLNMRAGNDSVFLVGRVKTGDAPDGWDAWMLSANAGTGAVSFERTIDVEHGDMFWDVVALPGPQLVAVGSTNYSQNPSGLSVSDERDALAVVLDPAGGIVERLAMPHGDAGRGNEAISVQVAADGRLVIAGMLDGPGTHAEVRSNGFLDVRPNVGSSPSTVLTRAASRSR